MHHLNVTPVGCLVECGSAIGIGLINIDARVLQQQFDGPVTTIVPSANEFVILSLIRFVLTRLILSVSVKKRGIENLIQCRNYK